MSLHLWNRLLAFSTSSESVTIGAGHRDASLPRARRGAQARSESGAHLAHTPSHVPGWSSSPGPKPWISAERRFRFQ